ncbi:MULTISPECIES: DUF2268 domain-containing protein [Bacillus]|uniref:DUF2268 domain-containing protein n=1 Tax=Bacillus TaxID=1386 RepID=UPI001AA02E05|nr:MULTISPECIES: DUF2268 domain-containing protein [Bacillus]MBO1582911.1 DUF2268 domain-containing protein [Bacillus sp. XF8]MBY0599181.1 DUF2268 domain-containing protein [Bacillus bingmayongensis]MCI0768001.1 DUF2268 domain-containing protein [Bacillus sp. TL12]
MKIYMEDTLNQYETLLSLPLEKRENFFRYTMMKPFEGMWNTINVPLKAKQKNGYDVMMATQMLGYLDIKESNIARKALDDLKVIEASDIAQKALKRCIEFSKAANLEVAAEELKFGMYIADPEKLKNQKGYCGFGGIPGYVTITIHPNDYNVPRIPALIAHEFHHNLRFSYFDWNHGDVTLGEYLVIEGLADSFATELFGEEHLGPWVTSIDEEELEYSIHVVRDGFHLKGFDEVNSYMFGDEIAKKEGYAPVGLAPGAGYAVGYHAVQSFMKKNNVTIQEATLLSTEEIITGCGVF